MELEKIILESHDSVWMPTQFCSLISEIIIENIKPNMRVLELGVGSGKLSILAGLKGAKVTGIDINKDAVELTKKNWLLNNLKPQDGNFYQSNLFSALDSSDKESFDLLISNPPTFPEIDKANNIQLNKRDSFELSGKNGRFVLDALLCEGTKWLKPNGTMITISTSKQGWNKTKDYLNKYWNDWSICLTKDIPLAPYYYPYIQYWIEQSKNEERVFKSNNQWMQQLHVIKAQK